MQDQAKREEFDGNKCKSISEAFESLAAANSFSEMEQAFAAAEAAFSDQGSSREAKL